MCQGCFDLDKKVEMMKNNPDCTGIIEEPFLTEEELMKQLSKECEETGKTNYRIIKDAVITPKDSLSWVVTIHNKPTEINVRFL